MPNISDYIFTFSGHGLGENINTTAGDTDGRGNIQTVIGSSIGDFITLDCHAKFLTFKDLTDVGQSIHVLDVISPPGREPNGLITGVRNYGLLYEWSTDGLGYKRKSQTHHLGGEILDMASSDINHDGVEEVVFTTKEAGIQIYKKDNSALSKIWERKPRSLARASIGDIDGDGRKEIVVLDIKEQLPFNLSVLKYRERDAALEFESQLTQRISGPILTADIDNDGRAEIIMSGPGERRFFVYKVLNRKLVRQFASSTLREPIVGFGAGDVDGDGKVELVVATSSEILIFRWNGSTYILTQKIGAPRRIRKIIVQDINFDGVAEIIIVTIEGRFFIISPRKSAQSQFLVREDVEIPKRLPPAKKVIRVEVENTQVTRVDSFSSGILVQGKFIVQILYSSEPESRVISFSTHIPFSTIVRTPDIYGNIGHKNIDVKVESTSFHFTPNTRRITVIIIAQITVFNYTLPSKMRINDLASQYRMEQRLLMEINDLKKDQILDTGNKIFIPNI
ncbi:MAG: DUF3794 domain-containing protein [Clostridia bacterium]|nr:DUF3794 domain-containing protein [Clostridia bacterium]